MIPSFIRDCSVKINGSEEVIGIAEFPLPEVKFKEEEINVLGLGLMKEAIISMPEAMETTIKFLGVDKTTLNLKIGKGINLVLAAAIQTIDENDNATEMPMYANLKGTIKLHKLGSIGANGKLEPEIAVNLSYFKLEINSKVLYEIDQRNRVLIVDGEDLRAGINAIIK